MGNNICVYKHEDLIAEDFYLKKRLMSFINDLSYFGGGTLIHEVGRKHLQRLIDIQLLIEARSWEDRKFIFGKF